MKIFDFTYKHIEKASTLALETYKEERNAVPSLPIIESVPDLTGFADNGLGVVAVEEGEIIGFLCNYLPFDHAFGSTDAKGMFSPMGGHAAIKENRAKIYATMYQAVATKWVKQELFPTQSVYMPTMKNYNGNFISMGLVCVVWMLFVLWSKYRVALAWIITLKNCSPKSTTLFIRLIWH